MSEQPVRLYRPGSGTEGADFHEEWCCHCQRDKSMREGVELEECDDNEVCRIIGDTFAYDVADPRYPKEWRYDETGRPICTAFVEAGQPISIKDDLTLDLFAGHKEER